MQTPMQFGPNDWMTQMQAKPQTWADIQGPAQMRPPSYPVVTPGHIPVSAQGAPGGAASAPAAGPANPMMGMAQQMSGMGQQQDGNEAAQIIRDRQAMSQQGLDRMQQIAASIRQRMGNPYG